MEKARGAPGSHLPRRARVRIEITWEIQGRYRGGTGEIEGAHRDHLEGPVPHGRAWVRVRRRAAARSVERSHARTAALLALSRSHSLAHYALAT